jgi:hypothetical protein
MIQGSPVGLPTRWLDHGFPERTSVATTPQQTGTSNITAAKAPRMSELRVSNQLLGNRAALDAAWERDGYWFFRDVLDQGAVERLRTTYLRILEDVGAIDDSSGTEAIHNGSSLENFPITRHDSLFEDPLARLNPMKQFVAEPAIHDFFKRLIGEEPVWLPVTEYHASPPRQDRSRSRLNFVHRDSTPNRCIPFRICWIPLVVVDDELGGLALTEGLHRPRSTDNPPSTIPATMPIPEEAIPAGAWRRATYRPGDVLIFDKDSPHSGLANYSDQRFRLSMDIRLMAPSDNLPMIGTVSAVDARTITVRNDAGMSETFRYDDGTYCRGFNNEQARTFDDIPKFCPPGSKIIVSSENGMARLIRPQR